MTAAPVPDSGGLVLSPDSRAALLLVLTWATWVGAALAPRGAAAVAVLAPPHAGTPGRPLELPPDVRAALAADWPAVRAALDAAHAALEASDFRGWPSVAPGWLTVVAWADAVRAGLGPAAAEWWEERAGVYEADAGFPRWYAECQASEDVVRCRIAAARAAAAPTRHAA